MCPTDNIERPNEKIERPIMKYETANNREKIVSMPDMRVGIDSKT